MLRFVESFDHYGTTVSDLSRKWTQVTASSATLVSGRFAGSTAMHFVGLPVLDKAVTSNPGTLVTGFAFKKGSSAPAGGSGILVFQDMGTDQCYLQCNANGTLQAFRGTFGSGTSLGSASTLALSVGTYYFVEVKILFAGSGTGAFTVNVDDVTVLSFPTVTTISTANAYANAVRFSLTNSSFVMDLDDIYICDTTGSLNNDFLGDCRVQTIYPDATGSYTDFSVTGAGSAQAAVNEADPDDDTSYVSSATSTNRESFTFTDLDTSFDVLGTQINNLIRKEDAGTRTYKTFITSTITPFEEDLSAEKGLGSSYTYDSVISETDPHTSAQWTANGLNNTEVGIEIE